MTGRYFSAESILASRAPVTKGNIAEGSGQKPLLSAAQRLFTTPAFQI